MKWSAVAAVVVVATFSWNARPSRAETQPSTVSSAEEAELTTRVNDQRKLEGLPELAVHAELTAKAAAWAATMADAGRIWHSILPDGITADWAKLGENVGTGGSVESLHQAFLNSPPHYANLVSTDFGYLGIGIAEANGRLYAAQVFMQIQPARPARAVMSPGAADADNAARPAPAAPVRPTKVVPASSPRAERSATERAQRLTRRPRPATARPSAMAGLLRPTPTPPTTAASPPVAVTTTADLPTESPLLLASHTNEPVPDARRTFVLSAGVASWTVVLGAVSLVAIGRRSDGASAP